MSNDPTTTIVGNLTGDPELRFISSGAAVVNFTVAHTPKVKDRATGNYVDGETLFMRCSCWREMAENIAESLSKGMRVIATGNLVSRSWESNGEKRTVIELAVEAIGPDLRFATAKVTRAARNNGGGFSQPAPASASNDPWASAPTLTDEPPF